jgi:hypothetical protein
VASALPGNTSGSICRLAHCGRRMAARVAAEATQPRSITQDGRLPTRTAVSPQRVRITRCLRQTFVVWNSPLPGLAFGSSFTWLGDASESGLIQPKDRAVERPISTEEENGLWQFARSVVQHSVRERDSAARAAHRLARPPEARRHRPALRLGRLLTNRTSLHSLLTSRWALRASCLSCPTNTRMTSC